MKFFVIADSKEFRGLLVSLLKREFLDAKIIEAVNGVEGRDKLFECSEDQLPDLVLTDFETPNLNGLELIKSVRKSRKLSLSAVKIILLTGFISDRVRAEAEKLRCCFLQKPFREEDFYRLLFNVLKS
ncbi:response regulator [Patescibacteria group bacterium]|nr:response regulator [Patescibacteria group bacterium]MBU4142729.1 response regulator [Patescibacteria group bacterium]